MEKRQSHPRSPLAASTEITFQPLTYAPATFHHEYDKKNEAGTNHSLPSLYYLNLRPSFHNSKKPTSLTSPYIHTSIHSYIHPFIHTFIHNRTHSILSLPQHSLPDTLIKRLTHSLYTPTPSHRKSLTMFFSTTRLSLLLAALISCVQAVAFTDDTFEGMAVGKAKNLTWSGDKSVCFKASLSLPLNSFPFNPTSQEKKKETTLTRETPCSP